MQAPKLRSFALQDFAAPARKLSVMHVSFSATQTLCLREAVARPEDKKTVAPIISRSEVTRTRQAYSSPPPVIVHSPSARITSSFCGIAACGSGSDKTLHKNDSAAEQVDSSSRDVWSPRIPLCGCSVVK